MRIDFLLIPFFQAEENLNWHDPFLATSETKLWVDGKLSGVSAKRNQEKRNESEGVSSPVLSTVVWQIVVPSQWR